MPDLQIKLHKPGKMAYSFGRGVTDTFDVMADDVGPLTNITVRIEATEDISDAWGLDKIDIVCGNSDWCVYFCVYDVPVCRRGWKYRPKGEGLPR